MIIVFVFSLFMACQITTPPSKAPSNETPVSMASVVAPITDSIFPSLSKAPVPSELMEQVRSNPLESKKILNLSERERDNIIEAVIAQRIAFYSSMDKIVSPWVSRQANEVDNKDTIDYEYPVWNAIEWGVASKEALDIRYTTYPYVGHSDADGKLHMKLYKYEVKQTGGPLHSQYEKGVTHLWLEKTPDWKSEFCVPIGDSSVLICNMAGAFDKYFLPVVRRAVPELNFNPAGVFPR